MGFEWFVNSIQLAIFVIVGVSSIILYLFVVFPRTKQLLNEVMSQSFFRGFVLTIVVLLSMSAVLAVVMVATAYLLTLVKIGFLHSLRLYEWYVEKLRTTTN